MMMLGNPFDISDVICPPPVEIAGADNPHIAWRLINDLARSLGTFNLIDESRAARTDKITAAVEMVKNLAPKDALEAQMIAQLVAAHNVMTEALHRANHPGEKQESQLVWLRQAARFMALFRQHAHALTKYRGTPKQLEDYAEKAAWKAKCKGEVYDPAAVRGAKPVAEVAETAADDDDDDDDDAE